MEISSVPQIRTSTETLPRVKSVKTLSDIRQIKPAKVVLPPVIEKKPLEQKTKPHNYVLTGLIVFSIAGMILSVITISRYDKLNKQLASALNQNKIKYEKAEKDLAASEKLTLKALSDRRSIMGAYRGLNSKVWTLTALNNKINGNRDDLLSAYRNKDSLLAANLQKENQYKELLGSKTLMLKKYRGDSRIAEARINAFKVQQEFLLSQLKNKDHDIKKLSAQLLENINSQEQLIEENIKLKETLKK